MTPFYLLPAVVLAAPPPAPAPVVLVTTDYKVLDGAVRAANGDYRVGAEVIPAARVAAAAESRADAFRRLAAVRPAAPGPAAGPDTRRLFAGRAQPVLSNLCASCHARPESAGGFPLVAVAGGYADPDGVARNLETAGRFVPRGDPAGSPLLRLALTAHGGQERPALPGPAHPAYRALAEWVVAASAGR